MSALKEIRQILSDIMIKETYFLADEDVQIDLNEEEEIILEDILDGNKLKIKYASIESAPKPVGIEKDLDKLSNSSENNIIKEEKKLFEFYLDDELKYSKKVLNIENLGNIRKILSSKIIEDFEFISKQNNKIPQSDESNLEIYKIIKDNNKIYLKSIEKTKNKKNGKKLIEIFLNDKLVFNKKLNILDGLPDIRKSLGEKIPENYQFVFPNGLKIDIDDEDDYILEEILNKNKLDLFCKNPNKDSSKN